MAAEEPGCVPRAPWVGAGGLPREAHTVLLFSRRDGMHPVRRWRQVASWQRDHNARPQLENESFSAASPGISPAPSHLRVNERQPVASGRHRHRRKEKGTIMYLCSNVDPAGRLIKAMWKKKNTPKWHKLYTESLTASSWTLHFTQQHPQHLLCP